MTRILVIGASRGIGYETVKRALELGHEVRGMARNTTALGSDNSALEPFPGDATDPGQVTKALVGMDAVIHALGVRVTLQTPFQPVTLFSRSTEVLVSAMEKSGPRRLLAVTGIGCGDSISALSRVEINARDLTLGPIYRDKNLQETIIRNSGLNWTLVRPTFLTRGARTGRYKVMSEPGTWRNGMISRADVADFLVSQVDKDLFVGKGPVLAH